MKDIKLEYLGKGPDFEYYIDIKHLRVYESIYGTLMPILGEPHRILGEMSKKLSQDNTGRLEEIILEHRYIKNEDDDSR